MHTSISLSLHRALAQRQPGTPAAALAPMLLLMLLLLLARPVIAQAPALPASQVYSAINLGPPVSAAFINDRNQAAFSYLDGNGSTGVFYDGRRFVGLGSLGGNITEVAGLNHRGDITGSSSIVPPSATPDWADPRRAFRWSAGTGMRALPGPTPDFSPASQGRDINDRGQVVGYAEVEGALGPVHAVRWSEIGQFQDLAGGPGYRGALASAINDAGVAVGFADNEETIARATRWQASGRALDLGTLGYNSYATRINRRGEVIGYAMIPSEDARYQGFFWSPGAGITAIGSLGGGGSAAWELNDNGEVGGYADTADGWPHAMLWTRKRGMVDLHGGPYQASGVAAMNNRGELVGWIGEPVGEVDYVSRAVRFVRAGAPVDLTSRLVAAPRSLVLTDALAVSQGGVILANSNAGLVMLRPGSSSGDDAPLLGPVEAATTVAPGEPLALTLDFTDRNRTQTHRAEVRWGDDSSALARVREANGAGTVSAEHRFGTPGSYVIRVRVTDSGGRSTEVRGLVDVIDPSAAAVSGQGAVLSLQPAAGRQGGPGSVGPLRFAMHASAAAARPGGANRIRLDGAVRFASDTVKVTSVAGQAAQLTGNGSLNGKPGYRIVVDVNDAARGSGASDGLRIRIMHTDRRSGTEVVGYDNGRATGPRSMNARGARQGMARVAQGDIVVRATSSR